MFEMIDGKRIMYCLPSQLTLAVFTSSVSASIAWSTSSLCFVYISSLMIYLYYYRAEVVFKLYVFQRNCVYALKTLEIILNRFMKNIIEDQTLKQSSS